MFEYTALDQGFTLRMSSDLHNVDRCIARIRGFLEDRDEPEHLFPLSLLAREALNNAMIHGNRLDPTKSVVFTLQAREKGFNVGVEDQGPGFAWEEKLQTKSDVTAERGRGHEIYRNYAHAVRYNTRGNALTLEYRGQ